MMMLTACGVTEPKVTIQTEYVEQSIAVQEPPKGVNMPPVEWYIITEENLEEKIAEMEAATGNVAIFAITPKGYENLALGIADLRRYIKDQQAIIGYYEEAIAQ